MTRPRGLERRAGATAHPPRARLNARCRLGGAMLGVVLGAGAAAAETPPAARQDGLTVAILDLAEAPGLMPRAPAPAERPAWRTSFGSERTTEADAKPSGGGDLLSTLATADAVLIQGVKAAAPLRRFFPPRTWRLIVSRKIIPPDGGFDPRITRADLPAATAIAVKARESLRVTARTHALRLDERKTSAVAAELPAAATAIRLVERGRTLWLASVALPPTCGHDGAEPCAARRNLDAWRETQRGRGELTVIGGRMIGRPAATLTDAPPAESDACLSHGIDSDFDWQTLPLAPDANSPDADTGCVVIVKLAD